MLASGERSAARDLDVQSATKVGLLLVLVVDTLGFLTTVLSPPHLLVNRTGLVVLTVGTAVLSPLGLRLLWNRLSWGFLYGIAFLVVGAFGVGMYLAGPRVELGVMFYVVVAIFGFYYFPIGRALSLVIWIAVVWAVQLAVQDGHDAPFARWFYVIGVLLMSVMFVNSLVRAAERSAEREKKARAAEEEARRELARLNEALEAKVEEQVGEVERLGRLRRFLSPNLADVVVNSEHETFLEPHRREIAVVFIDLRGFTKFASATEPEDVLEVLRAYYDRLGVAFARFDATVGPLQGDGVMAYFNDPFPCEEPAVKAIEMADAIAGSLDELSVTWRGRGYDIGYGIGVAFGYATLGMIGFEGRQDYGPLGTVVNLGSRLCDLAMPGQILIDRRTATAAADRFDCSLVRTTELKGFRDPVDVFELVRGVREAR